MTILKPSRSIVPILAIYFCSYWPVIAEDGWLSALVVPADEAFQAAAADQHHFYAITSNRVAKYQRSTGQRLAISTGPAKHLNSGFVWHGKLLCAHSNYPQTPEISEIKILDPKTMLLSTFKEFGNYGGSLTWVLRHDDHWWCNFALYGEQNGQTFLVQFDDDWKEVGRWTYPAEVITKLGNYSLSGGVWFGDELLVTGHDAPVIFRLQIPQEENVLLYLGQQSVPFTGQGIAVDPNTNGLIGINRRKRTMILSRKMAN